MTEQQNQMKNSLLNSYLIINQLLEMDFKSKYYKELKLRMTTEELEAVKYLQHARSLEKLKTKKENNQVVNSSRGRRKQAETPHSESNNQHQDVQYTENNLQDLPPSYPN